MRPAERPGNSAIFDVTLAAKCPEHPQRGGCYMGFGLCLPQPHSSICLIPLWLAVLKRPSCVPGPHVGLGRERPPPKQGGHAVPHRWQVLHASVPDPMGSLTSLFIPAGRLGKTPFPLALHCVGSVLAVKGSLRRFAPWTAPGRSERRAAYEGKGGGAGRGARRGESRMIKDIIIHVWGEAES